MTGRWVTPSYCSECRADHPGPCGCWCHRPAAPACPCPEHPASVLVPFPGGAARGSCPVDGRTHQMYPPEVKW